MGSHPRSSDRRHDRTSTARRRARVATACLSSALVLGGAAAAPAVAVGTPTAASTSTSTAAAAATAVAATDAPARLRIGAPSTTVRVTVVTRGRVDGASASLVDRTSRPVAGGHHAAPEPGRPSVLKTQVTVTARDLPHWGPMRWDVSTWSTADGLCALGGGPVGTDVRAHSMLGLAVSRSGSSAVVRGSLRAYTPAAERYAAWSGRPVSVQRWDGRRWVQVTGVATDREGNVAARVQVPSGTALRLVAGDAPGIWGAVSASRTA